jgi:hypothetical protein
VVVVVVLAMVGGDGARNSNANMFLSNCPAKTTPKVSALP